MSTAIDAADAVKTVLNAAAGSPAAYAAIRVYVPAFTLEECKTLRVAVMPHTDAWILASRNQYENNLAVDVGVYKLVTGNPATEEANPEIDALVTQTKTLARLFGPGKIVSSSLKWIETLNDPVYDRDRLRSEHIFASLITLTFKEFTAI
jgi:hypothetical protein